MEPIEFASTGKLGANAMPNSPGTIDSPSTATVDVARQRVEDRERAQEEGREEEVQAPAAPAATEAHAA